MVYILFAGPSNVFKIVKMIMERNFQPVIIFSFSKKDCEAYALQMTKLDFNTGTILYLQFQCYVKMSVHECISLRHYLLSIARVCSSPYSYSSNHHICKSSKKPLTIFFLPCLLLLLEHLSILFCVKSKEPYWEILEAH